MRSVLASMLVFACLALPAAAQTAQFHTPPACWTGSARGRPDRDAGGSGTGAVSPARRINRESHVSAGQLNVPGSPTTGATSGAEITPPSSQQGAGPQAGSHTGAAIGAAHGSERLPHGERNSMKDGRRQLLRPKQLEQPLVATKPPSRTARHTIRDMMGFSSREGIGAIR